MGRIDTWNCDECNKEARGDKPNGWITLASNGLLFGNNSDSPIDHVYFFCSLKCLNKWLKGVQKKMINLMEEKKKLKKQKEEPEYDVKYTNTIGDIVVDA